MGNYYDSNSNSLKKAIFPSTLKSIGDNAFYMQTSLNQVFYTGTPEGWKMVSIGNANDSLLAATLHCDLSGLIADFTLPAFLTTIESEAFAGSAFTYAKLPEGCTSIGWHAFADCPNLAYIYIPEGCAIDADAFSGVSGLTILGTSGGSVETWAGEHGYSFSAVG